MVDLAQIKEITARVAQWADSAVDIAAHRALMDCTAEIESLRAELDDARTRLSITEAVKIALVSGNDSLRAERDRLRAALIDAQEKLVLYRAKHGGEYIGGMEYLILMKKITGALEQSPRMNSTK
jgi:hypothetical protein